MDLQRRPDRVAGGEPSAASSPAGWVEWRERRDRPVYQVAIWPHRSMSPAMRKGVLVAVGTGLALPLVVLAGTMAFWGMLPFVGAALLLLWLGFRRSDRDRGARVEELTLWRDELRVERREPTGRCLRWSAEPMKVRLRVRPGPMENYLTLTGGGREIELGAFLSPPERLALMDEIEAALTRAIHA